LSISKQYKFSIKRRTNNKYNVERKIINIMLKVIFYDGFGLLLDFISKVDQIDFQNANPFLQSSKRIVICIRNDADDIIKR
jgi:hypothetical protein